MSEEQTCAACRFWLEDPDGTHPDSDAFSGLCRRYSPKVFNEHGEGFWPRTDETDFCGEWAAQRPEGPVSREGSPHDI